MKNAVIIFCLLAFSCTQSETTLNCDDGFPKSFGNQIITKQSIDTYLYDNGNLIFVRSINPEYEVTDRTILMSSPTKISDSSYSLDLDIEMIDGCVSDWRDYERKTIDHNCTIISIDYISIGVNAAWLTGVFDCNKSDSLIIQEAVDYFASVGTIDSVQVDRLSVELQLTE